MPASQPTAALIVEGQPFIGMVASDILREVGFKSFHATDAASALALLRAHPEIEVVVTEAELGGSMSGVELSRTVSAERPDIQLVVTSSGDDLNSSDVPAGTRLLRKPFASAELRRLVARMSLLDA